MKDKYRRGTALLLALLLSLGLLLSGCAGGGQTPEGAGQSTDTEETEGQAPEGAEPGTGAEEAEGQESRPLRTFTDDCGREVEVPEEIRTVIASGTLSQIILFALAPEKLMAINGGWTDDAAEYVDEVYLDLPEVGSFFGNHDLNYEEIAKLGPDIIIDVGE